MMPGPRWTKASWWALGVAAALALLAFVPPVVVSWRQLVRPPPITVHGLRYRWTGPRTFETQSDAAEYTNECPSVTLSRYVLLEDGSTAPLQAEILSGPLVGQSRAPRWRANIKPEMRAGARVRLTIPDWVEPGQAEVYVFTQQVANNEPCVDGWTGAADVARLKLSDPPDGGEVGKR